MPDKIPHHPMTDERPAEPDTTRVLGKLAVAMRAIDDGAACRAVEAAARTLAIEYAESRVRATPCPWPYPCRGTEEPCETCQWRDAELAALARLKEPGEATAAWPHKNADGSPNYHIEVTAEEMAELERITDD